MKPAVLSIRAIGEFPAWTFTHYLSVLEANYLKLFQVYKIVELLNKGAADEQFFVTAYSAELYPAGLPSSPSDPGSLVVLEEKGRSAAAFWQQIRRRHRPLVFYRPNRSARDTGDATPLYTAADPFALKFPFARIESPIEVNAKGAAELLHELRFGNAQEERAKETHEIEMQRLRAVATQETMRAARETVSLIDVVQNSSISSEYKERIMALILETRLHQTANNLRLNASIGLEIEGEVERVPARSDGIVIQEN